jgi:hypothetical protein
MSAFIAGRDRAEVVIEMGRSGTADHRHLDHVTAGQSRPRILLASKGRSLTSARCKVKVAENMSAVMKQGCAQAAETGGI